MRHNWLLIILLLLPWNPSTAFAAAPSDDTSLEEEIDPKQEGKDKKIWSKLLAWYENARKLAQGALEFVETVEDYAWTDPCTAASPPRRGRGGSGLTISRRQT